MFEREDEQPIKNSTHQDYFLNLQLARKWISCKHPGPEGLRIALGAGAQPDEILYFHIRSPKGPAYGHPVALHQGHSAFSDEARGAFAAVCEAYWRDYNYVMSKESC